MTTARAEPPGRWHRSGMRSLVPSAIAVIAALGATGAAAQDLVVDGTTVTLDGSHTFDSVVV